MDEVEEGTSIEQLEMMLGQALVDVDDIRLRLYVKAVPYDCYDSRLNGARSHVWRATTELREALKELRDEEKELYGAKCA